MRIPLAKTWASATLPFRLRHGSLVQIHGSTTVLYHSNTNPTFSSAPTQASPAPAAPPTASYVSDDRPGTPSNVQSSSSLGTLTFGDHRVAFSHKSFWELLRALLVLRACAINIFVDKSYQLMTMGERLLGEKLMGTVVSPFYRQFVTGNSENELAATTAGLKAVGLRLMVAPMVETDLGEDADWEAMYNRNLVRTLMLVGLSAKYSSSDSYPVCQTKFTAHLSADALARISTWYESLDFESRVEAVRFLSDAMKTTGGEVPNSNKASTQLMLQGLNNSDMKELQACLPRLYHIGDSCREQGVVLAVDAEYTYTNPAINLLCMAMMDVFNKEAPVVWNTYQGYLKNTGEWLRHDLEISRRLSTTFGIKLVRGAYLETERKRAQDLGYSDPVNNTYEDTNNNYNKLMRFMLDEIQENPVTRSMIIATHNEESVGIAASYIKKLSLDPRKGNVIFGQVFGMAENISVPLAKSGYLVYKSVPYGSVSEVLPYLSRRANENRAVMKGARRERQLISRELLRRLQFKK